MGIVASRRKRRALNRQLSALATGYFTDRQIREFRAALGTDPIKRETLFEYLSAEKLSERLQRSIVRECSHGESEDKLNFADFLNARVILEQRYSENALIHCRNVLLNPQGQLDMDALVDSVQPEWTWLLAGELEGSCLTAWLRVFCASEDGWSINRFMEAAADLGPTLLVVRDTHGGVFGCYAPESWAQHGDFYGDEGLKAFVFQLAPTATVFRASGHTNSVQWCCRRSSFLPNGIGIGGIQRAQALFLSEDLSTGHSRATVAFTNPPMSAAAATGPAPPATDTSPPAASDSEGTFEVAEVECWAVDPGAVAARAEAAAASGDASVLEAHQKELAFLGITGRTAYSAGFREEVPEEYKQQLRV